VLLDQFETVFYSKLPLPNLPERKLAEQDLQELNAPFGILWEGLKEADEHAPAEVRANSEAVLVGTKNYRAPGGRMGLGPVRYRFCYVLMLSPKGRLNVPELFRGREGGSSNDLPVWKWQIVLSDESSETTTLYVAWIERSYLLVSDTLSDLQGVSRRLKRPEAVRGALSSLPEWGTVSQQAYWGYRRYQRRRTPDPDAAGLEIVPRDANALILLPDFANNRVILHLIGASAPRHPKWVRRLHHRRRRHPNR
jgi:hypothetical protein